MSEPPIVVDISALQSAESRGRGIARYALSWCIALEKSRPNLVRAYVLNPSLPPPGSLRELIRSGKVTQSTSPLLERATIFHQLAPFDLTQSAATLLPVRARGQLTSATVYDLIPAIDDKMLSDPRDKRRYRTRLELVRSLHHIQTLSDGVASQLNELLDIDPARITNVGAAPDPAFTPPQDRIEARNAAIAKLGGHGLRHEYVLYASGSHPRKNNELLIEAWSRCAPEIHQRFQLVIAGNFDDATINHLHHLASNLGIGEEVIVPSYVQDDEIVALTQGASLACFASLAEGFGLPIVEAMACQTPVIASAISPHDELLSPRQLFDPTSTFAVAEALTEALMNTQATSVPTDTRGLVSWAEVADRSATTFDKMLDDLGSRPMPQPLRRARPRIALVSPLPPAPSGIARYSYRFIEEMVATEKVEVTCFTDGPTSDQITPEGVAQYSIASLQHVEHLTGRFDEVVYVIGNSHHHLGALAMLKQRRGLVMSHDVRLSNLYRHAHGDPGLLSGGLSREINRMYSHQLPASLGAGGDLSEEDLDLYGLLMARDIISLSTGFLVTSFSARHLASLDARPRSVGRITTLPFAMEAPNISAIDFVETSQARPASITESALDLWGKFPPDDTNTYLAHFGIVDPIKEPHLLVDMLALLSDREEIRLAFVGPISEALSAELVLHARELGIEGRIGFTGPLSTDAYLAWLGRTALALQLRSTTNGEASAAIGECLSTGLATVVSDIGWSSELPRDAVHHVRCDITPPELAVETASLLDNERLRHTIGDAGAIHAKHYSFEYAARALLQVIAERSRARQSGRTSA